MVSTRSRSYIPKVGNSKKKSALLRIWGDVKMRRRITYTLLLLLVCRIGAHISVPGINSQEAVKMIKAATGGGQNLFQLMDVFSGGAFAQMTVTALGVMPYITASIVMQVVVALVPSVKREMEQNQTAGKRKVGTYTRFLTVGIALFQSSLFSKYALQLNAGHSGIILDELLTMKIFGVYWLFYLIMMSTMTAGTVLLMWIGEQISDKEKGIGNGLSLIITLGILSSLPSTVGSMIRQLNLSSQQSGQMTFTTLAVLAFLFIMIVLGTILVMEGQRRIPLQYARRNITSRSQDDNRSYIPLKINYAGVIPVIFASSLLMFPATIAQFVGKGNAFGRIASSISPGSWGYTGLFILLIVFFTYFWTSTQFKPEQIASDLKDSGGFIPGVRQGTPTAEYLTRTMDHITFMGAMFLSIIAVLPMLVGKFLHVDPSISYFFGGTSLLILVGVVLETKRQIDTAMLGDDIEGAMRLSSISSGTSPKRPRT